MTISISKYAKQPNMLPWKANFPMHEQYREKPTYFWWKVLKNKAKVDIYPPISEFHLTMVYDLTPTIVRWIFNNIKNPFYCFFEEGFFRFYFDNEDEAFLFKMSFV